MLSSLDRSVHFVLLEKLKPRGPKELSSGVVSGSFGEDYIAINYVMNVFFSKKYV